MKSEAPQYLASRQGSSTRFCFGFGLALEPFLDFVVSRLLGLYPGYLGRTDCEISSILLWGYRGTSLIIKKSYPRITIGP